MRQSAIFWRLAEQLPAQADEQEQRDFIERYNKLQNHLPEDEIIYCGDAAHPDHQVRPAHGWFHRDDRPVVSANSGRKRVIHVILDNAKYHHAVKVREWLSRTGCKIKIIWLPSYAPHLNSIERL